MKKDHQSGAPENRIPAHVAVIMDGNGRWAGQRGLPRIKGHEAGAESVRAAIRAARDAGVRYLTLYAFSVDNWARPRAEVGGLMKLLGSFLRRNERELHENRVRLRVMGRMADLPAELQNVLNGVMDRTGHYGESQLILALSYGSRTEITDAVQGIVRDVAAGELAPGKIDEAAIAGRMYLPDVPDPDLVIRTSGELRLSNFMLWQASYSEFYFTDTLWPDFRDADFHRAVAEYGKRKRRFGKTQ